MVKRQKPKPKYSSQTNLLKSTLSTTIRYTNRPRSASFFERRSHTSLYLRPQSADPKFGRNFASPCDSYSTQDSEFTNLNLSKKQQKKYQSVSSSNLLKLLLDEPIKRSWLCKDFADNSDGATSDLNSSRISSNDKYMSSSGHNTSKLNSNSMICNQTAIVKNNGEQFYKYRTLTNKPDLPGRVSFSKLSGNRNQHIPSDDNEDSSDYDNLNAYMKPTSEDISAPGPLNPSDYGFKTKTDSSFPVLQKELSSTSLKKSVHFGSTANGEEIIAETFEYPKCPSENCSCSTRSSSSSSLQESPSPKCYCSSSTCKYLMESFNKTTPANTERDNNGATTSASQTNKISMDISEPEESQVIKDYKNAVGEQLENSVVKNLLEESHTKSNASNGNLNNFELPSYLSKYSNPSQTPDPLDKQNNLTEHKTLNSNYKSEMPKKDFLTMDNKLESPTKKTSSDTVINNYLKVAASTSSIIKKKDNNNLSKIESNKSLPLANNSVNKPKPKTPSLAALTQNNIKKAKSFGSLREDSNLHEFNIDKIDSWMSMHESTSSNQDSSKKPIVTKHSSLEESFEKFTQETLDAMSALDVEEEDQQLEEDEEEDGKNSEKSMDQSQDDSTYEEIVSVIKEIEEDKKKGNILYLFGTGDSSNFITICRQLC